jgi:hypothetical protein
MSAMSLFRKLFGRQDTAIPSPQHGGVDMVSLVVLSRAGRDEALVGHANRHGGQQLGRPELHRLGA